MAAQYVVAAADADTGFKWVSGFSAQEVNASAAATTIYLRNASDTGDKVVRIELAANESVNMDYSTPILFTNKCFVDLTTGDAEITVFGWA